MKPLRSKIEFGEVGTMERMTLKEFEKLCKSDANLVKKWDTKQFKITCRKCDGDKVVLLNNLECDVFSGSEYTGSWVEKSGSIIVKCLECGSAMTIISDDV